MFTCVCMCACVCRLFRERVSQVKEKLEEVLTGRAGEFKEPLSSLQNHMQLRGQVAGKGTAPSEPYTA